jgi:hypothetical protein
MWTAFVAFGVSQFFAFKEMQNQVNIQGNALKQVVNWVNAQQGVPPNAQPAVTATPSKR